MRRPEDSGAHAPCSASSWAWPGLSRPCRRNASSAELENLPPLQQRAQLPDVGGGSDRKYRLDQVLAGLPPRDRRHEAAGVVDHLGAGLAKRNPPGHSQHPPAGICPACNAVMAARRGRRGG
jgi:hypothetical protein